MSLTADDLARFRLPRLHSARPQRRVRERGLAGDAVERPAGQGAGADLRSLRGDSIGTGRFAFGVRSARLATAAMALGGMFVLQSPSSNLYALRAQIGRGLASPGPALFSVFSVPGPAAGGLAPYLVAAAALQSRAFPAFSYEASAGGNWAARFSLENNPRRDDDWPVENVEYVDTALQRVTEPWAFTFADFALCDARHSAHFARVARAAWSEAMLPAADWLALDESEAARRIPYLLAIDGEDALHRVIVDLRLMQAARRCLLLWRRLQEHGGVHDSHAERLLALEKAAWTAAQVSLPATSATAPRVARIDFRSAAATAPRHLQSMSRPPPRTRPTRPGSRPRAARAQRMPAHQRPHVRLRRAPAGLSQGHQRAGPTASWSRLRKAARSRSSIPASRAIQTRPASPSCWSARRRFVEQRRLDRSG